MFYLLTQDVAIIFGTTYHIQNYYLKANVKKSVTMILVCETQIALTCKCTDMSSVCTAYSALPLLTNNGIFLSSSNIFSIDLQ
mmetsp:Transcript_37612/g.79308  ORF Transcript_37612/g.79308 Transcript_37612/m.79308 type:complete len:83 (-) Transcript_37612:1098-1346(-)